MIELKNQHCSPVKEGSNPLGNREIADYRKALMTDWEVVENKKLRREFLFQDFKRAMAFVQEIAALAENEQHHPDIHIYYSKVVIELWTHTVGGISVNDFIMASRIEAL